VQALRQWSFLKVMLLSGGWLLLWLLVVAVWLLFQFRGVMTASSTGSGGIGAVSFGINALTLLIPVAPPVVLIIAWLVARAS